MRVEGAAAMDVGRHVRELYTHALQDSMKEKLREMRKNNKNTILQLKRGLTRTQNQMKGMLKAGIEVRICLCPQVEEVSSIHARAHYVCVIRAFPLSALGSRLLYTPLQDVSLTYLLCLRFASVLHDFRLRSSPA